MNVRHTDRAMAHGASNQPQLSPARFLAFAVVAALGLTLGISLQGFRSPQHAISPSPAISSTPSTTRDRGVNTADTWGRTSPQEDVSPLGEDPAAVLQVPKESDLSNFAPPGSEIITGESGAVITHYSYFFKQSKLQRAKKYGGDGAESVKMWRTEEERKRLRHIYRLIDEVGPNPLDGREFQIVAELGGDGFNVFGRSFRCPASPTFSLEFYREYLGARPLSKENENLLLVHLRRFQYEERKLISRIVKRIDTVAQMNPPHDEIAAFACVNGRIFWVPRQTIDALGLPSINDLFKQAVNDLNDLLH